MKAPEYLHEKLAAIFRPIWKWRARPSASTERNKRIREMLEKERILKELAKADKQPVKLGGMGRCYRCGEIVSNLALHEARCGQWDDFGNPVLSELEKADRESRITMDPGTVRQIQDTGRSIR